MIRVALVDDELLVRAGLRMILQAADDIEVVGEASDGDQVQDLVARHSPDVLLMDIRMPGTDGLSATRSLIESGSAAKIIVLTTFDLDDYVFRALSAGASGFLLKDTPPRELIDAVRVVADGDAMLSPKVTRSMIRHFAAGRDLRGAAARRIAALTAREVEVLAEVSAGRSNADIAGILFMSEATVKAHVSRIIAKLGATNRVQVAIVGHDAGLGADSDR
ncbi:response regulator transcription factor [Cumulibacter soli]|uniref:response regulator transcription factor n=1 Tax=Cumulibacter soli TaxID=2546344 RepID=UPI0010677348|nr:response regulator transcription factor [Cumulibacter soli]